ncbi:MAG: 50S ribosomal protein L3 [Candidatus Levybacteria bacterium]|nr:50S ribosomal protein L3 [Candidatus Levybacteria bacterium]
MNSILAKKIEQGQKFLENGKRIPITALAVNGNIVVGLKTPAKNKYSAVQLGFDKRAKARPAKSLKSVYNFIREVRLSDADTIPSVGDKLLASAIFKPGDIVNVTGISKGKGYAGGVKRYHFKGGPRTHGQSDRERAPGAIGTTTTPGRVYRGKRMAGRMGHEQVTVKNLQVVSVNDENILVKGLVPGGRNTLLMLKKVGEKNKKFVPLYQEVSKEEKVSKVSNVSNVDMNIEIKDEPKTEEVKPVEVKAGDGKEEVKANAS